MKKYFPFSILFFLIILSCKNETHKYTNELIDQTSPYLLQHAHNPVNWKPWNSKTLELAKAQNKLLLISIGYSSCHWCNVMEQESSEDEVVAKSMNQNFVNIKVDREERPDVDKVYMNAVQLMTGKSGWPLNVITLPDGRPIWGGTYFEKEEWLNILKKISKIYSENPEKLYEYADKLEKGLKAIDEIATNSNKPIFKNDFIIETVKTGLKSLTL